MATKKASTTSAKKSTKPAAEEEATKAPAKTAAKKAPAKSAAKSEPETKGADSATGSSKKKATHDEISKHAHSLWEKGGRHHGSHVDHWLRAEKELNG